MHNGPLRDIPPICALRPINPDNARGFCITAAAGTELASPYSSSTVSPAPLCRTYFVLFFEAKQNCKKQFFRSEKKCWVSSQRKAVYDPKAFFPHAASLDQAFAHCRIFSTAATRRCTHRVAVASLGITLSRPLPVIALVSHYLTN